MKQNEMAFEVKAILQTKTHQAKRVVFYVFNGKSYVVLEHFGKNHWLEDDAFETTKEKGNALYKQYVELGYTKMPKSVCEKWIR